MAHPLTGVYNDTTVLVFPGTVLGTRFKNRTRDESGGFWGGGKACGDL